MNMIYFDSAATTIPCENAAEAIKNTFESFGNPSSIHSAGLNAKKIIDSARKSVAFSLSCKPDEIIFTGCGSESNNQAIFGLAKLRIRRSKRIITSDSEHPSVSSPIARLEEDGWEIVRISTKNGALDIKTLESELAKGCAFVSIMLANNETGALYDIAAVRKAIDKSGSGAIFHCDGVQGYLKVADKRLISKNCDLASFSAHKIGGVKGVGALYCKSGIKLPPFILGGGQEGGLRSGTENVLGIAAFGAAAEWFDSSVRAHISDIYSYLTQLFSKDPNISLHIPEKHIDTVLSIAVKGVRSEVMLNALSAEGICISAGSACSARKGISHALGAFGLPKEEIESTLRISIGAHNTTDECDILFQKITETANRLRR